MIYTRTPSRWLLRERRETYSPTSPENPHQIFHDACVIFQQRFHQLKNIQHATSPSDEETMRIMLEGIISMKSLILQGQKTDQE
jgi:hypothetical protein